MKRVELSPILLLTQRKSIIRSSSQRQKPAFGQSLLLSPQGSFLRLGYGSLAKNGTGLPRPDASSKGGKVRQIV